MSRFFAAATYNDEDDFSGLSSSSDEESLRSVSSDSSHDLSSGEEEEESDDSFFNVTDEDEEDEDEGDRNFDDDDSDSKPYGPDWFKKSQFRKGPPQNKFLKSVESSDESDLSSDNEGAWDSDNERDENGKKIVKSARDKLLDEMKTILNYLSKSGVDQSKAIKLLDNFDLLLRLQIRSIQQNFGTPPVFIETLIKYNDFIKNLDSYEGDLQFDNKSVAKAYNVLKQRVKKSIKENQEFIKEDGTVAVEAMEATMSPVPLLSGSTTATATGTANFQDLLEETSAANFFDTLQVIIESRGKKNIQSSDLIFVLNGLLDIENTTPYQKIMAYLTLIPIRLESNQQLSYQPIDQWNETFTTVTNFMSLLEENINKYNVSEFAKYNDILATEPKPVNDIIPILGSIFAFVERLDDEFNKSLLNIDPHSSDYLLRLKDESKLYTLLIRVQLYLEKIYLQDHPLAMNRIIIKRLNHIYYKTQPIAFNLEKLAWNNINSSTSSTSSSIMAFNEDKEYVSDLINKLVAAIVNNVEASKKTSEVNNFATDVEDDLIRSGLFKIYYHALNLSYKFDEIKEMLITLNVNKVRSQSTSTSLQILFNRVVVQLGLSAFKSSLIEECHEVLNELLSSSHLREILGQQSLQRLLHQQAQNNTGNNNINTNLIATEQCLPFHKHINLDLVDVVFMTCSLIMEIPPMTAFYSGIKIKKTPYNAKSIRRILEHFDKQNYQPPAETSRDFILFAAKAMQTGEWVKCYDYLLKIKAWNQLSNHEEILANLQQRIKLESIKTYLFSYKRFYSNISVDVLAERFQVSKETILEEIPKLIKDMEITSIKLNDSNDFIVLEKGDEITKLEEVAIKLNKEYKINKERLFPQRH